MRWRGAQDGDGFVESAEIAQRRSILHRELRMPGVVEAEFERAFVLGACLSFEAHRVVHACQLERGTAIDSGTCISQYPHGGDTFIAAEGIESLPELFDGPFPPLYRLFHGVQSVSARSWREQAETECRRLTAP